MCASPAISSGVVDMQTAAVAWLRTARCRIPLPRRGGAECRVHTAPLSACAAGPAPLGTCIRWGHAFDPLPPSSHVAPSPHPNHRPARPSVVRDLVRLSGSGRRWAAGGRRSATTVSRGGRGAQEPTKSHYTARTAGPPPGPRPPRSGSPPGGVGCGSHRAACMSCVPRKSLTVHELRNG